MLLTGQVVTDLVWIAGVGAMLAVAVEGAHAVPRSRAPWLLIVAAYAMFWLSDVQRLLGGDVWPRVPLAAGATRLGGDALLLVGLVLISRATRAGRDVGGRLDASIIATTLAVDPMLLLAAMALFASVIGRLAIVTNELRGSHEQIAAAEARDELTGLASRTKFTDHLDTVLRQPAERGAYDAILLVDLDDFKAVNGGPGHAAGDALLFELGMRLLTIVRPSDLIARMGGDEFAILIEGEPLHTAIMVAQRVIRSVHEPVSLGGDATVYANASISIVYAHKGTDVDDVLRDADIAMYLATSRGKGRWEVFEPGDVVKFDRGFVSASLEQSTGVLAGLIDLANDLDIDTVGERVEEGRRLASLRDMRCRYAQGFMISRPLPPEQLGTLMAVEFGITIAPRPITASGSALPASSATAASLSR